MKEILPTYYLVPTTYIQHIIHATCVCYVMSMCNVNAHEIDVSSVFS